jgi:hypothetical protein
LPARDSFFWQLRYIRHRKAECDGDHGFQELFPENFNRWTIKIKPGIDEYSAFIGFMISAQSLNMQRLTM